MSDEAVSILSKLATANRRRSSSADSGTLVSLIVEAMRSKKADDIVIIDMRTVSDVADYFVICSGDSDLQIKAVVESIEELVDQEIGERPWRTEGLEARQWVVVDYVDVVVHVFDPERRGYYNLERLWADAPLEHVDEAEVEAGSASR